MSVNNASQDEISIVLLDNDPIFTLGLKEVLKTPEYQDINIIATGKIAEFITLLPTYQPSLWLISLDINKYPDKVKEFLNYLPQLNQQSSEISIVLLLPSGFMPDVSNISIIKGFCYKDADIEELIKTLRMCVEGENCFNFTNANIKSKKINNWFSKQCHIGLKEIQQEIKNIEDYLQGRKLSISDSLYWQGRKRELKLAKWLISQMMPNSYEYFVNYSLENKSSQPSSSATNENNNLISGGYSQGVIVLSDTPQNTYDLTLAKIKASVKNSTGDLLEIDILQESKKQELLIIILDEWVNQLNELVNINIAWEELPDKTNIFIKDIWQNSAIKFLSRYYKPINNNAYDLVDLILKESTIIQQTTLIKIPFILDIIDYQINQKSLIIDSQIYDYNSESGKQLEEIIWQNIIINIANSVMAFTLNRFSDDVSIKQTLFNFELKSSRKVAMFRNNLVWKYRQENYWQNPQNIFEDKFTMLKLSYQGIDRCIITHSRHDELNNIKGLPWLVTILVELRDSLSKGIKSLENTIGKALIYVLTEIIGKGIGLIGKGILQGIGKRIKS
jgi:DNA-binding NarL/FixJ family response regulator